MRSRSTLRSLLALAALASLAANPLPAATFIFKDGFVLQGEIRQDSDRIGDRSGQVVAIPKGPFYIVDGVRQFSFSRGDVQDVDPKDLGQTGELVRLSRPSGKLFPTTIYPIVSILKITDWDSRWERKFTIQISYQGQPRPVEIPQRMVLLTPKYAVVDAPRHNWTEAYATSELGYSTVRGLLDDHPDLKLKRDKGDSERRFKTAKFLRQAGWFKQALDELDQMLREFPEEKQRVEEARGQIKGLVLLEAADAFEQALSARRHRWLQQQLAAFPKEDVDPALLERVRKLSTKYEFMNDALREARKHLKDISGRLQEMATKSLFQEASAAILEELNEDNAGRLETFVTFARQKKREGEKEITPEQLLSLAVSGWLLGKESAENKVEVARRLWSARDFLMKYLRTHEADRREKLLVDYQRKSEEAVPFDELTQMVGYLPPPDAELPTAMNPLELSATNWNGRKNALPYLVQLPSEYHPGRAYPVLIVLHQLGEGPKEMLSRFSVLAERHGYILAAPTWARAGQQAYGYSAEEHAAVVNVLKDLRRRLQVDSDRVFLAGGGEGGSMAFDVGLSHPDLFAGVLPVSGALQVFSQRYSRDRDAGNAQNLPFYVVNGTHAGTDMPKDIRKVFEKWTIGFPSMHVEYNGRGLEWFPAEVPVMFDWMNRKKRASGYPNLGRFDFVTMRESDNSFYWLTADAIDSRNVNNPRAFDPSMLCAKMSGWIAEGNQVHVRTRGVRHLTVWLTRDAVDFTKPVTFRINGGATVPKIIKPDLKTLLENLYERGDRQHLFVAKALFPLK